MLHTLLLTLLLAAPARSDTIDNLRWMPLTDIERAAAVVDDGDLHTWRPWFTPYNTNAPKVPYRREILADRDVYMADDPVGQFVITFIGADLDGASLDIEITRDGSVVAAQTVTPLRTPKLALMVKTGELNPGQYVMSAKLKGVTIKPFAFEVSAERRDAMTFPEEGVKLHVHEQAHVPDAAWPITTGIPLPRDTQGPFILTENGEPVAAQFNTRATWQPDGSQPKWLALDFIAKYDNGKPREYRILRQGGDDSSSPSFVTETDDTLTVNTGALTFTVNRRAFAGPENITLPDGTKVTTSGGGGGPFLMDERLYTYNTSNDPTADVYVESAGPVRTTIVAKGWYVSDRDERACQFQTRLTAWAGKPWIDVEHVTVITYDTDKKRLRELGFSLPIEGGETWKFGGDGKTLEGDIPDKQTVYFHQDRHDHFRIMPGGIEGKRSDGWAQLTTDKATINLYARNLWQLFPKEIELGANALTFHQWPRHGHIAYTDEEALDGIHIHKLRYAHQGKYLDLQFPQAYFDAFTDVIQQISPPTRGGRFLEQQDINALTANGRGLAISSHFLLTFGSRTVSEANGAGNAPNFASLYQDQPHAIADPIYTGLTEVEGRFAGFGADASQAELDRVLTEGLRGFNMSVDYLENYGQWIWPDTHNNWTYVDKSVQGHRWWLNSHYQGVWEGLFLYLRSGDRDVWHWARDNTEHFKNVSTVNYHDPDDPMQGKIAGANFHTKGFLPWGSPRYLERTGDDYVEVGAHFVNPDAHILRYLLLGDRRALSLALAWGSAFDHVALPPERSREAAVTLGEMLSYYELTWDPQAILFIRDLASDMFSRPWPEIPAFPVHPMFHDRWVIRYWNRTRDDGIKQRIFDWFEPGDRKSPKYGFPQLAAQCYWWTGDKAWLTDFAAAMAHPWRKVYDNPGDPLHAWGGRSFYFPSPSAGQMWPYFMQAMIDADLAIPPWDPTVTGHATAKTIQPEKNAEKPTVWFTRPKDVRYGELYGYLQPHNATGPITITVEAYLRQYYGNWQPHLGYVHIADADGNQVAEASVLPKSQRPTAELTLDPTRQKTPYLIYTTGTELLNWSGDAESLTVAPTPAEAATR